MMIDNDETKKRFAQQIKYKLKNSITDEIIQKNIISTKVTTHEYGKKWEGLILDLDMDCFLMDFSKEFNKTQLNLRLEDMSIDEELKISLLINYTEYLKEINYIEKDTPTPIIVQDYMRKKRECDE